MRILINDKKKMLGAEAIDRAESRVNASFAKFGYSVKSVNISVVDVNGPRGGVDKECRILVKLRRMKDVSVTVRDESLSKALANAIHRSARSVARQLERRSVRDGRRASKLSFDM